MTELEGPRRGIAPGAATAGPPIVVESVYLKALQLRHNVLVSMISLAGLVAGVFLAFRYGFTWLQLGLLAAMYTLTGIGMEVGYHRLFTHRAFKTGPRTRAVLAVLGAMSAQGPVINWVANHRRHHQYSDRKGDPHSPRCDGDKPLGLLRGLWHAHMGWMFDYETPSTVHFCRDLLRDPMLLSLNRTYYGWVLAGVLLPALAAGLITWSWYGALIGLLWGGLLRIFVVNQAIFSINSLCHTYGKRAYETKEDSTNNGWLALPSFGQSWHNNHHAFPASAMTGLHWWQVDLAGWIIRLLELLGLAWDVQVPTPAAIVNDRRRLAAD